MWYLLVEEFTGFLLDGVEILDLSGGETHDESDTLGCGGVLVEVVTCRLSPFVDSLVYRLAEVYSLQTENHDTTTNHQPGTAKFQGRSEVLWGGHLKAGLAKTIHGISNICWQYISHFWAHLLFGDVFLFFWQMISKLGLTKKSHWDISTAAVSESAGKKTNIFHPYKR